MNENISLIVMCFFLVASIVFLADQILVLPLIALLTRAAGAQALLLAVHHVGDQLQELLRP